MTTSMTRPSDDLLGRAAADPARPAFHFTSPAGWLNDPNGLAEIDGVFHLFYQYNPKAPVHAAIQWGHATSRDLVSWTHQPVALAPTAGPDEDGCWSGVLVDDGGTPTLVYSGNAPRQSPTQTCCLAVGSPDGLHWVKDAANPVIPGPPAGLRLTEMRDHSVWREGTRWRQVMGAGIEGRGGGLMLFGSDDLHSWDYEGVFAATDDMLPGGAFAGTTWECPDVMTLPSADGAGTRDVIVFSAWDKGDTLYPVYVTGRQVDDRFVPDAPVRHLDDGLRHFYAPQSFAADDGRRIQFGWSQEARPEAAVLTAGWSGVMSLPRTLALQRDGSLGAAVAAEVDTLRDGPAEHISVDAGSQAHLTIRGTQLDISGAVRLAPGGRVQISVLQSMDGLEGTPIVLRRALSETAAHLVLDRSRSRRDGTADGYDQRELGGPVPVDNDGNIPLRVIVDHSIIEVFAAGRPLTARVYPSCADSDGVAVSVDGPQGGSAVLEAWRMREIDIPLAE